MEENRYKQEIREIHAMMNRSSRFISLSGWSGISAGVIALMAAYIAYRVDYYTLTTLPLIGIAALVILMAIVAVIFFTRREAEKNEQPVWNVASKRLVINLSIPLVTGGLICLAFLLRGNTAMLAPITLVFYGLALVNASKYTLSEIRSLGLAEITLGIIAIFFTHFGLLLWALGFGVLHIIYGIMVQTRKAS